jgi:hypothetical protein
MCIQPSDTIHRVCGRATLLSADRPPARNKRNGVKPFGSTPISLLSPALPLGAPNGGLGVV